MAIRIDPDTIDQRAASFRQQRDTMNDVLAKMDGLISQLEGEWEGHASTAFRSAFAEIRPNFVTAAELIETAAQNLNTDAENFRDADRKGGGN